MKINEDWKTLKPLVGKFLSDLDLLYKGAENVADAISRAEERGYKKGYQQGKHDGKEATKTEYGKNYNWLCKCLQHENEINKYLKLSVNSRETINNILDVMFKDEECKYIVNKMNSLGNLNIIKADDITSDDEWKRRLLGRNLQ